MAKTVTENNAVALSSTGNSFVDFFIMLSRNIETDTITKYMTECWSKDPKKTLAIVFNARDRQNGKKEKNISNRCMIWLKRNKNNTYAKNMLNYVNKYGCWKDVIYLAIKNPITNKFEIELISKQLKEDKENLDNNKNISLCAKWASSEQDKNDKNFNLAHHIADEIFPDDKQKMKQYRNLLVPLRKRIDIVETYMILNKWNEIDYNKVPAVAMRRLNKAFQKHDSERYQEYLNSIVKGEKKMKTNGLLPHELVKYYLTDNNSYNETIELQWNAILDNVKAQGILKNMIAIVDVSGSMYNGCGNVDPIYPSIALGLLISKCVEGPFANKIIAFSESPVICKISGETLYDQVNYLKSGIPVGLSTNFEAVFDLLINTGNMFNIPPENMPETVVCLSDMQFNEASNSKNKINENTLHDTIINKYSGSGYNPAKFIYWNLNGKNDGIFPISTKTENVAMISGFSEQLLKVFMTNTKFDAETIIDEILIPYMSDIIIDETEI